MSDNNRVVLEAKLNLAQYILLSKGYRHINLSLGMSSDEFLELQNISKTVIPTKEFLQEVRSAQIRLGQTNFLWKAGALAKLQVQTESYVIAEITAKAQERARRGRDLALARRIGGDKKDVDIQIGGQDM